MKMRRLPLFFLIGIMIVAVAGCSDDKKDDTGVVTEEVGVSNSQSRPEHDWMRIHFKKPWNWGDPRIYVFGQHGAMVEQYAGDWPGKKMKPEGNGWYVFTINKARRAHVIFTDGNNQIPRPNWPTHEFTRDEGEWWYNGSWYDHDPEPTPGSK